MSQVHTIVAGAGVVGLAIARAEAMTGADVLILEQEERFGRGVSARNSEVLHAGIFHAPDTLKTRLCVAGRRALTRYCATRAIPHRRCGKLLVATDEEELGLLDTYAARARANGFEADEALVPLSAAEARALEPELRCRAAWLSPATGIVDAHGLMAALLADAEAHGAVIAHRTPVTAVAAGSDGFVVTTGGRAPAQGRCRRFINAAGLGAPALAHAVDGYDPARIPRLYPTKGTYFTLPGRSPFTRPIYPPQRAGSSIHATIDLGGQCKFGPDAEPVTALDYAVDPER